MCLVFQILFVPLHFGIKTGLYETRKREKWNRPYGGQYTC